MQQLGSGIAFLHVTLNIGRLHPAELLFTLGQKTCVPARNGMPCRTRPSS